MSGVAYAVGLPDHVALFPPYERSSGWHRHTRQPLARGPRYAQGPGRGDTPGYWHRVRSAVQRGDGRITLYLWCGQTARHGNMRYRLDDPDGDVCGTCIGRALGAGQDVTPADLPNLAFHPAGVTHPLLIMSLPWFSVDSSGFSSAYRYARLSLFDPRKGKTVGVTLDGRDVFKYSVLLRDVYGVDPAAIAVSTSETRRPLVRVALSAVQKTEDYLRRRHGLIPSPKYGVKDSAAGAHIHADGKAFPAFGEDTALGFPTAWQGDAIKGGPHVHSALGFPTAQATKGLSPEDTYAPVVEESGPHVHYVGTGPYLGAAGPPGSERRSDIGFPGRGGGESIRGPETQRGTSLRQTGGPVIHASIGSSLTDFSYIVNRKGNL